MQVCVSEFSNPDLKNWVGRKFLISGEYPTDFATDFDVIKANNLFTEKGFTNIQIKEKYKNVDWVSIGKHCKDNDIFICRKEQMSIFGNCLEKHTQANIKYLENADIKDLSNISFDYDNFKELLGYELNEKPITDHKKDNEFIPFLTSSHNLLIYPKCDNKYKWWYYDEGMSIVKVLNDVIRPQINNNEVFVEILRTHLSFDLCNRLNINNIDMIIEENEKESVHE